MGSYLSIVNDTNDTYSVKVGSDEAAVGISSAVFGAIAAAAGVAGLAGVSMSAAMTATVKGIALSSVVTSVSTSVHARMEEQGYTVLRPGERKQYGKFTLSLWQQCTALRTRLDGDYMVLEQLNMRPIFSGPTDNSNNDHSIQWWINKWGHAELSRTPALPTVREPVNEQLSTLSFVRSRKQVKQLRSTDGLFCFIMQDDGNVVLYKGGQPKWASNTHGQQGGPFELIMQEDGNLVAYTASGQPFWASNTYKQPHTGPFKLIMQDDGNCVIYNRDNKPTWATNTWER